MSTADFLDVLMEVGGHSESLTASERDFLLKNTGLTERDLSEEAQRAAQLTIAESRAAAAREVERTSMTTAEVAEFLGRATSNVRRSRLQGDLYAVDTAPGGRGLRFPLWQFTEDRTVVPGLRRIMPAFPRHFHPLDIRTYMTTPNEGLHDASPVEWLVSGRNVEVVAESVEVLEYV